MSKFISWLLVAGAVRAIDLSTDLTQIAAQAATSAPPAAPGNLFEVPWDTILDTGSLLFGDCPKQKDCVSCRALGCDFCDLSNAAEAISTIVGHVSPILQDTLEQTNLFNDGTLCGRDQAKACATLRTILFLSNVVLNGCPLNTTSIAVTEEMTVPEIESSSLEVSKDLDAIDILAEGSTDGSSSLIAAGTFLFLSSTVGQLVC